MKQQLTSNGRRQSLEMTTADKVHVVVSVHAGHLALRIDPTEKPETALLTMLDREEAEGLARLLAKGLSRLRAEEAKP